MDYIERVWPIYNSKVIARRRTGNASVGLAEVVLPPSLPGDCLRELQIILFEARDLIENRWEIKKEIGY